MKYSSKISIVINTYNEEKNLQMCLDHLKDYDEIVVCDMESTDSTLQIAERNGCKIVVFPRGDKHYCEAARDFAIHSASNDWVFVVDADEVVPESMTEHVHNLVANADSDVSAYLVPRMNYTFGAFAKNTYPDYQLRIMRRSKAYWPPVIHVRPNIDGKILRIEKLYNYSLIHANEDVCQAVNKMNGYTNFMVEKYSSKVSWLKIFFIPQYVFFRYYILKGGFTEGRLGLISSIMKAVYKFILLAKRYEREQTAARNSQ